MISAILFVISLILSSSYAEHVQDFCVADYKLPQGPAGYPCKDPKTVTADDFFSASLRVPGNTSNVNKFGFTPAIAATLPGLNGLGISAARVDLDVGGAIPLHTHRGGTELVVVVEGSSLVSGFIASDNKVYQKILNKGDAMVFPQGLHHYIVNQGKTPAFIFASLSSDNPGVQATETALFQNDLATDVIAKTTLLDVAQIQKLKGAFGGTN